ncbi:hypothetical protein KY338_06950 [Candidatus Woesearchaeota archaeon]|nr:hypothetical protein [Candidatus Woesearchaeota archaeon]MBW3006264.1 hypothetical protein [Candidatus Woesearchaeota archaeon]
MKITKKLVAVMLMVVFALGAAAGAIGANFTAPVQDNVPVPVPGDSASLADVTVDETPVDNTPQIDEDNEPVCPTVPVCPEPEPQTVPDYREISMSELQGIDFSVFGPEYSKFPEVIPERDSPGDYIKEYQIHVYPDKVIIDVQSPILAAFADTNSMDPVFDAQHNAIEIVPKSTADVRVGDIVSYKSDYGNIIHRVKEIGQDENGWYAIFQGDNNPVPDPGRIRFEQIQRKAIAFIY